MLEMLLLTLSLFTPLCSHCKDSVHIDLIQGEGDPYSSPPKWDSVLQGRGVTTVPAKTMGKSFC